MRHRIARLLATGSAALTITGGMLALAGTAEAATSLSVTLSSSGSGASAVYDAAGDPVLTVGTPAASTYAEITIDSPSAARGSAIHRMRAWARATGRSYLLPRGPATAPPSPRTRPTPQSWRSFR